MTARTAVAGIGVLLLLSAGGVAAVLALRGTSPPVLIGLLSGGGLGGLYLALESFSLSWALRVKPSAALQIALGGFILRLVTVAVLTLIFIRVQAVDAVTFALSFVASFFVFLILLVWIVDRIGRKTEASR